ncbi:MAG: hypothetical protein ACPG8O_09420 [Alcanivorax nanhaiticus]
MTRMPVCFLLLVVMLQPAMASELDHYDAYLLVYADVDPAEIALRDRGRMELIDVKHRLIAAREALGWLEPLRGGNRYRVMVIHAQGDVSANSELQMELDYRDGFYQAQLEQLNNGRRATFRLYPLERRDLAFFREQRVGKWETRESSHPGGVSQDEGQCNIGYRRQDDTILMVHRGEDGLLSRQHLLSGNGDQLVQTLAQGTDKTPIRRLEYALAEAPSIRLSVRLEGAGLADYGNPDLSGGLTLVSECSDGQ